MVEKLKILGLSLKQWLNYLLLAAALILIYLGFVKKYVPDDLPERPTRYPGGDDKPEIPGKPKDINWAEQIKNNIADLEKKKKKLKKRHEILDDINKSWSNKL